MVNRPPLSRERVVEAAAQGADRDGLAAVSTRNVGKQLGVEAMSLCHHVASRDDLLDGLADWVFTLIHLPAPGEPWRAAMRARALSLRRVLSERAWALTLTASRRVSGAAVLRHHDAVLGCLRADGFSVALAAHAFSAIDAYVYGLVLTELKLPFGPAEGADTLTAELNLSAQDYPHLAELLAELVTGRSYRYADEFENGLILIFDGLARRVGSPPGRRNRT